MFFKKISTKNKEYIKCAVVVLTCLIQLFIKTNIFLLAFQIMIIFFIRKKVRKLIVGGIVIVFYICIFFYSFRIHKGNPLIFFNLKSNHIQSSTEDNKSMENGTLKNSELNHSKKNENLKSNVQDFNYDINNTKHENDLKDNFGTVSAYSKDKEITNDKKIEAKKENFHINHEIKNSKEKTIDNVLEHKLKKCSNHLKECKYDKNYYEKDPNFSYDTNDNSKTPENNNRYPIEQSTKNNGDLKLTYNNCRKTNNSFCDSIDDLPKIDLRGEFNLQRNNVLYTNRLHNQINNQERARNNFDDLKINYQQQNLQNDRHLIEPQINVKSIDKFKYFFTSKITFFDIQNTLNHIGFDLIINKSEFLSLYDIFIEDYNLKNHLKTTGFIKNFIKTISTDRNFLLTSVSNKININEEISIKFLSIIKILKLNNYKLYFISLYNGDLFLQRIDSDHFKSVTSKNLDLNNLNPRFVFDKDQYRIRFVFFFSYLKN
ncbi:hypothetical protein GVAV_003542 [Gurleya vavrai]